MQNGDFIAAHGVAVKMPPESVNVAAAPAAASSFPNFTDDIPSYFPVHLSLRLNTNFTKIQFLKQIDDRIQVLEKVVERFLGYLVNSPHLLQDPNFLAFLSTQIEAYTELKQSKFKLETLQEALKTAHTEFVEGRRFEADLKLDNYGSFHGSEKLNFADAIVAKLDKTFATRKAFDHVLKADPTYQYLTNVTFVLEHPEDPLPDDATDEDLAISGGKISLKDPLSMDYFSEPVLSAKCQHVYEKKHIRQQLAGYPQINCPVTGCSAQVTGRDLREDKLMALRVKVFQATEKKREQRVRI